MICLAMISIVDAKSTKMGILASYEKELTGDSHREKIKVIRKENKVTEMVITSSENRQYRIPLPRNAEPHVTFGDLNHDGVKDVFITIPAEKHNSSPEYKIYTLKDEKLEKITLPNGVMVTAQFENGYKASIQIKETGQSYVIDLKDQKNKFDQIGIFQDGLLNEPTELMIHSMDELKPVRFKDFSVGLKSRQSITDGFSEEIIGYVDSTWKWSNANWELHKTTVKKVKTN